MNKLNPNAQRAMKLLGAGDIDEARTFIDEKLADLEDERIQLYKVKSLIPQKIQNKLILRRKDGGASAEPLTKDQRREVIKKYAQDASKLRGGAKITAQDVVDVLKANGIDLGVEVPNTTVGNVLIKSGEWKRLDKGVFQYEGERS